MRPGFLLTLACTMILPALREEARAQEAASAPFNQLVLESLRSMPSGGGYSTSAAATGALRHAVTSPDGMLRVDASRAVPSYCSGATYLVFLKTLATLAARHRIDLSPAVIASLRPSGEPDGTGIWGRWNANGPGTARLFHELGLGENFAGLAQAQPGDFLKIFWNDGIGAGEYGHSVIYLKSGNRDGVDTVTFWSSNIPGGFGERTVPLRKVRRMIFSRLLHPEAIAGATGLPRSDRYLASLERRSSSASEMERLCGITR